MLLFPIIGLVLIIFFSVLFLKHKKKIIEEQNEAEKDELVFDEITGKHLTVEELVKEHQLDYLDDEKVERIYSKLENHIQEKVTKKEVENILEFHYQLEAVRQDKNFDEETKTELIKEIYLKKGKQLDDETIAAVLNELA